MQDSSIVDITNNLAIFVSSQDDREVRSVWNTPIQTVMFTGADLSILIPTEYHQEALEVALAEFLKSESYSEDYKILNTQINRVNITGVSGDFAQVNLSVYDNWRDNNQKIKMGFAHGSGFKKYKVEMENE